MLASSPLRRRSFPAAALALSLVGLAGFPAPADAQPEEARSLFERGTRHLTRAMEIRGQARERELNSALEDYARVIALGVRSRNVIFNLGLVHQELGRAREAFNYFSEYLRFDLSQEDLAAGRARLETLRPAVATVRVQSEPPGAEVRVDRSDLPAVGRTPIEIAVEPGSHTLLITLPGYEEARSEVNGRRGALVETSVTLTPLPIPVQVIAPAGGELTLDGDRIQAGTTVPVSPGPHVLRLQAAGRAPIERRFEVAVGAEPMTLTLTAGRRVPPTLRLELNTEAEVLLDEYSLGADTSFSVPVLPGPHRLRVRAAGYHSVESGIFVPDGTGVSGEVTLRSAPDAVFDLFLAIGGPAATASVLATGALAIWVLDRNSAWEQAVDNHNMDPTVENREAAVNADEELEVATFVTDVMLAVTAGLGTLALVSLIVVRSSARSELTIAGGPGGLSLRGQWSGL